tara:strand:+ start:5896 stop:6801 length:906 start_codon:yes stop_codon:yes gene_type:complete
MIGIKTIKDLFKQASQNIYGALFSFGLPLIVALVLAFSLPNIYQSKSVLEVIQADDANPYSQLAGNFSGVAGILGFSLPGAATDRALYVESLINSRTLFKELIEDADVAHKIFSGKKYDFKKNELIYSKQTIIKDENLKWKDDLQPTFNEVYEKFLSQISVRIDTESRYIILSYEHPSPFFAKQMLEKLILEVNENIRTKDIDETQKSLDFLYLKLNEINEVEIRNEITSLIQSKLSMLMLTEIKENYVLDPIEKPFIPEEAHKPSRTLIVIIGFIFGFFLLFSYLFLSKALYVESKPTRT